MSSRQAPHEGQAVTVDPLRRAPHTAHVLTGLRLMDDAVLMLSPPGLGHEKSGASPKASTRLSYLRYTLIGRLATEAPSIRTGLDNGVAGKKPATQSSTPHIVLWISFPRVP